MLKMILHKCLKAGWQKAGFLSRPRWSWASNSLSQGCWERGPCCLKPPPPPSSLPASPPLPCAMAGHRLPARPAGRARSAWGGGLRRKGPGAYLDCPRVPSLLVVNWGNCCLMICKATQESVTAGRAGSTGTGFHSQRSQEGRKTGLAGITGCSDLSGAPGPREGDQGRGGGST